MQGDSLLSQGLELMLIGMGTVFVFLSLLVVATKLMSALSLRLQPAPSASNLALDESGQGTEEEIVAAIAGAISEHQKHHR